MTEDDVRRIVREEIQRMIVTASDTVPSSAIEGFDEFVMTGDWASLATTWGALIRAITGEDEAA